MSLALTGAAIQAAITAALSAGQSELSIPAGTYILTQPVRIPPGTRNFKLYGAGPGSTILASPANVLSQMLYVGDNIVEHNNWGIYNRPNVQLETVNEGDTELHLVAGGLNGFTPQVGDYCVLWDAHVVYANGSTTGSQLLNRAQNVIVTAFDPATGIVTIDQPAGRAFDTKPALANVSAYVCRDVSVSGFGFDGAIAGTTAEASGGCVTYMLAEGGTVEDIAVNDFLTNAVWLTQVRGMTVDSVQIQDSVATTPGNGYGVVVSRSSQVSVSNGDFSSMQQGFIMHAGSMDVIARECHASACGLDGSHGMDERRIQVIDCSGAIQFGNQAWPEGCDTVSLQGGYMSLLNLCANVRNVNVGDQTPVSLGLIQTWSQETGVSGPGQGPTNVLIENSTVQGLNNLYSDYYCYNGGLIAFKNCTFDQTRTAWGNALDFQHLAGSLSIDGCTFNMSAKGYPAISLSTPGNLQLSVTNSKFENPGVKSPFLVAAGFGGKVMQSGNTLNGAALASNS
jgi:hypothetical protein